MKRIHGNIVQWKFDTFKSVSKNVRPSRWQRGLPTGRMLLKRGMGNGEWGMGNGEWGMRNNGQR